MSVDVCCRTFRFNFYITPPVKWVFLLTFRGIFNTGLTVFPDLSSIHSDDPNFIL